MKEENYLFFWGHTPKDENTIGQECLSQWYPCEFEEDITDIMGNVFITAHYNCAEQFMMAKKALLFDDQLTHTAIMDNSIKPDPKRYKELGRQIKNFNQKIWDEKKKDIVRTGNLLKFSQNQKLFEYLIGTYPKKIVEASPYDRIWGIGYSKDDAMNHKSSWGQNLLGETLMFVREELGFKVVAIGLNGGKGRTDKLTQPKYVLR